MGKFIVVLIVENNYSRIYYEKGTDYHKVSPVRGNKNCEVATRESTRVERFKCDSDLKLKAKRRTLLGVPLALYY